MTEDATDMDHSGENDGVDQWKTLSIRDAAVPTGTLHRHKCESSLGPSREIIVYTPPAYVAGIGPPLSTLYLLHGSSDPVSGWIDYASANVILDNLIALGTVKPMVVVMPYGHMSENIDDDCHFETPVFEHSLIHDIVPYVESHYVVSRDTSHRAIAGLSMGGAQAMRIGLWNLNVFSSIGIFSAGAYELNDLDLDSVLGFLTAEDARQALHLLYVSIGTEDWDPIWKMNEFARKLDATLTRFEIAHIYREMPGGHDWTVWNRSFAEFVTYLT